MNWMNIFGTPDSSLRIVWLIIIVGIGLGLGDICAKSYKKKCVKQEEEQ